MLLNFIITGILLLIATIMDLKKHTIKNIIPLVGIILGSIVGIYTRMNFIPIILMAFAYFFLLFYIPRMLNIKEFMGAGDIKLYIALTFLMGTKFSIYTFIYSIFIGCLVLMILNFERLKEIYMNVSLIFIGDRKLTIKSIDNNKTNAYAIYIFISIFITYFQMFVVCNDWLFR